MRSERAFCGGKLKTRLIVTEQTRQRAPKGEGERRPRVERREVAGAISANGSRRRRSRGL